MRNILFRGKPVNNDDYYFFSQNWKNYCKDGFVYGSLVVSYNKCYICVSAMCNVNCCINNGITSMIEVIPETVGQYTGLPDKNRDKIFEGDIVTNSCGRKKAVEFYEGRYYPFIAFPEFNCWDEKECEVIGNIHNNPKLLGGDSNGG